MSTGPINLLLQSMIRVAEAGHKHTDGELARATKLIYEDAEQVVYPDSPTQAEAEELAQYFVDGFDMDTMYSYAVERMAHWYRKHPESYREDYPDMHEDLGDYYPDEEEQ